MINVTFHTFELSTTLSGRQFQQINKDFKAYKSKYFSDNAVSNRKIFITLKDNGILIYLHRRLIDDMSFIYTIVYKLNPLRMFDSDNYVGLFHSNDTYKIPERMNELLRSISQHLPLFHECCLTRFDFCANIILENRNQVTEYIRLLNQSFVPCEKYKQKMIYDSRSGRYNYPIEEATFTHANYVEVSIYNKNQQLTSEKLKHNLHSEILRCEIRCQKQYINMLKRKFMVNSTEEFLYSLPEIGSYVFNRQLKSLQLANSYFEHKNISDYIEHSSLKNKTKQKLINFSRHAAIHRGIQNAVEREIVTNVKSILKKFSDLGICAMPLPYRSDIKSGTNLLDLCLQYADIKNIEEPLEGNDILC